MKENKYEYIPNKSIWLVFDMDNGHSIAQRYVWWFNTKKEAISWSNGHIKNKFSSNISEPKRFYPYKNGRK